jgi:protein-disulfide isomerase
MGSVADAIGKVKLNVTTVSGGTGTGTAPTPTPAPAPTVPAVQKLSGLDYSSAPSKGGDGSLVMVEYSDFECPYCSRVEPTLKQVLGAYPDMKFVYQQFPLSFHPNAQKAAEASLCAHDQGKFWELHEKLYASQQALSVSDIKGYVAGLGMDAAKFNACLDSGEKASQVASEEETGASIGIRGTPGFMVYSKSAKGDALVAKLQAVASSLQAGVDAGVVEVEGAGNGIVFAGALPYASFKEVMDAFN